jgi:hypothetical protein
MPFFWLFKTVYIWIYIYYSYVRLYIYVYIYIDIKRAWTGPLLGHSSHVYCIYALFLTFQDCIYTYIYISYISRLYIGIYIYIEIKKLIKNHEDIPPHIYCIYALFLAFQDCIYLCIYFRYITVYIYSGVIIHKSFNLAFFSCFWRLYIHTCIYIWIRIYMYKSKHIYRKINI